MKNRISKFLIAILLGVTTLSSFAFKVEKAEAQTAPVCVSTEQLRTLISGYSNVSGPLSDGLDTATSILNVPTNIASVTSLGLNAKLNQLVGLSGAIVSNLGTRVCDTLGTAGNTSINATNAATNATDIAQNGTAVAGALSAITPKGNSLLAGKNVAEISTLTTAIAKIDAQITALQATAVLSKGVNEQLSYQNQMLNLQNNRKQMADRLDSLKKQRDASLGDFARAFVIGLIHDLSLSVTNQVASKLVDKFHINNYLAYADTVANQVYSIDYIKKNYPDNQNQLIVGSLYRAVYNKIPSAAITANQNIVAQAAKYGGPECISGALINDPDFVFKMAKCGSTLANPQYLKMEYMNKVQDTRQAAMKAAEQDVNTSDYYPGRDCKDTLGQQQQFDEQAKTLAEDANKWQAVYQQLVANRGSQADIEQAKTNWMNAQDKASTLTNRDSNEILLKTCEGITNPGKLVQNFVDGLLKNQLDSTNQLTKEDLPSYLVYLKNVVGTMVENLIFGKGSFKTVLKEAGLSALSQVGPTISGIISNAGSNSGAIEIYTVKEGTDSPKNEKLVAGEKYELVVDFSGVGTEMLNAKTLVVSGLSGGNIDLTKDGLIQKGSVRIPISVPTQPISVSAKIYLVTGTLLASSVSLTVEPQTVIGPGGPTVGNGQISAQPYNNDPNRFNLSWDFSGAQIVYIIGDNILDQDGRVYTYTYNSGPKGSVTVLLSTGSNPVYKFEVYKGINDKQNNIAPIATKTIRLPEGTVQGASTVKGVQARGPVSVSFR